MASVPDAVPYFASALFAGDLADAGHDLLPAAAHVGVGALVLRQHEAGMDHMKPRALVDLVQRPGDDGVERRAVAGVGLVAALPRIGQTPMRNHLQHLAMNDAIPGAPRLGLIGKALARR